MVSSIIYPALVWTTFLCVTFFLLGFDYVPIRFGEDGIEAAASCEYMLKLDAYQKRLLEFDLNLVGKSINDETDLGGEVQLAAAAAAVIDLSPQQQPKTPKNVFMFGTEQRKIKVEIYRGNLVKQQVDVIVNAANSRLILGGKFFFL